MISKNAHKDASSAPLALNEIHNLDCGDGLPRVAEESVDVIVTSPPYWGQRGNEGLGTEPDPRDYVSNLVELLSRAMRTLKPEGTLWLNIGDAFNTPINWREKDHVHSSLGADGNGLDPSNSAYTKNRGRRRAFVSKEESWLQYGNLLAIPGRVTIAMCDLGYLYRGEIIWRKSRPMPEGRCRRPHRRHEGIYVFAKSERHRFRVKPPVGSVWDLVQAPNNTKHCSTFPLDLPVQCIDAAAVEGRGLVLDPFMGSGTTALAARTAGHDFIGFEKSEEACAEAAERLRRDLPLFR